MSRAFSRNRTPCIPCQAAKRKCDQEKPKCSRCQKKQLSCQPSVQAAWRNTTISTNIISSSQPAASTMQGATITSSTGTPDRALAATVAGDSIEEDSTGLETSATLEEAETIASPAEAVTYRHVVTTALPSMSVDPGLTSSSEKAASRLRDSIIPHGKNGTPSRDDVSPVLDNRSPLGRDALLTEFQMTTPLNDILFFDDNSLPPFTTPFTPSSHHSRPAHSPGTSSTNVYVQRSNTHRTTLNLDFEVLAGAPIDRTRGSASVAAASPQSPRALISCGLVETIDNILGHNSHNVTDTARQKSYAIYLWKVFRDQIAPGLTALGHHPDNPFLRYLVPEAERDPALLTAILFLTLLIERRRQQDSAGDFIEQEIDRLLMRLEVADDIQAFALGEPASGASSGPGSLAVIIVLCMGFIAKQDITRLVHYMEYATIICQDLFRTLAGEESFLYLVKLLGFMQNALLFSAHAININTPDYLGVALEILDSNDAVRRWNSDQSHDRIIFSDLDIFSGMAASMASTMYSLGNLIKRKRAGIHGDSSGAGELAKAFESDVDGLEARLRRRLTVVRKSQRLKQRNGGCQTFAQPSLAHDLDMYNVAVFWSAWAIFLTEVKNHSWRIDPEIEYAVCQNLEACAQVPRTSPTAPLLLFPLNVGGMRTKSMVHREFVLTRLTALGNLGLTDTHKLCENLVRWWDSDQSADNPVLLTNMVVF